MILSLPSSVLSNTEIPSEQFDTGHDGVYNQTYSLFGPELVRHDNFTTSPWIAFIFSGIVYTFPTGETNSKLQSKSCDLKKTSN